MEQTQVGILLVEDNENDVLLTRRAFQKYASIPHQLDVVSNGLEAMRFLRREAPYTDARPPDLILLDLHMPIKDGWWVLEQIKWDDDLKAIPVLVLTSSQLDLDIYKAYQKMANSYVRKPDQPGGYKEFVEMVEAFWLRLASLPSRGSRPPEEES